MANEMVRKVAQIVVRPYGVWVTDSKGESQIFQAPNVMIETPVGLIGDMAVAAELCEEAWLEMGDDE